MSANFATGAEPSATDFEYVVPRYAIKPTDQTRTSTTTLADDADLTLTVEANKSYELGGLIAWACASGTPDFDTQFTVPAGATLLWYAAGPTTDLASQNAKLQAFAAPGGTPVFFGTNDSATFPAGMLLRGLLTVGATPGSITFQWAQVVSNASGITVKKNSFIKLVRVA